jgi:hypothetical protein
MSRGAALLVGILGADHATGTKSRFLAPHIGQDQESGMSSNAVPGGIPPSGSPRSGS